MSRIILLGVVVAGVGAAIYYYLNQPAAPVEQPQAAAEETGNAVSEAVESVTEQAGEAASSVTEQAAEIVEQSSEAASDLATQAGETATELADQAGEEVAALTNQGQKLLNSWVESGAMSVDNFDYDAMVASVQESTLAEELKVKAVGILDDIKASPATIALKIQELQALLTGQ